MVSGFGAPPWIQGEGGLGGGAIGIRVHVHVAALAEGARAMGTRGLAARTTAALRAARRSSGDTPLLTLTRSPHSARPVVPIGGTGSG